MIETTFPTSDSGEALIRGERLWVEFGRNRVLRDVTLSVARGETVAIIGESGCGKTVLLKTLIGLLRPTRGTVWFDGQDLGKLHERELTRQRTRFGFVFQQAALFDSMTIGQNVAFPLRQHTAKEDREIRRIVLARLAEVGLPESVVPQKPAELSGGMRKRVGLARALALDPELVLYDEPTTGLDPIMGDVINELILGTRKRHPVTSIVVTHDMRTARKVADRVVMLYPLSRLRDDEPQILYDGPPDRIDTAADPRVSQFVRGEAGERLMEMRERNGS
ncbi:MAG: ABC transporter ATP-binding protein [Planctomycetes bacterium RBG_16_64_12]|nr:MAG: ABC transporter ATP-binding protein [Planctomycetes bacterium RBG_16_64_12]